MIGNISIEKFKVDCFIGIYEFEKKSPQSLILEIIWRADLSKSIASDRLENVDYDKVIAFCQHHAQIRHYHLLENFAYTLLESLFEKFSPLALQVVVTKSLPLAQVSVTLQKGEL